MASQYIPHLLTTLKDGQKEVTNRSIEHYLRSLVHDDPRCWIQLLPWAELWFNSTYNQSIGMSPFHALYGRDPPAMQGYLLGSSKAEAADKELCRRNDIIKLVQKTIKSAQDRMKYYTGMKRKEVTFDVGENVITGY